jgi:hypothetical protein
MKSPASENVGRPAITEGQVAPPRNTESLVKRLGDLRDGLLLLAGVLYLLGYLSWTVYALKTGIGLVPVLDSQYFAAGVFPAAIVLLFILSVRLLRALQKWLTRPLPAKRAFLSKVLASCGFALIFVYGAFSIFLKSEWLSWLMFGCVFLIVLAAFFGRGAEHRFLQLAGLWLIRVYSILGAFWLLAVYVDRLFPSMSSEFGGPKPRCIQLDMEVSQLSPESYAQLLGSSTSTANPSVARSVPLYLIFDGTEYLLLSDRSEPILIKNNVYRLRKESVKAIFPCNEIKGVAPVRLN